MVIALTWISEEYFAALAVPETPIWATAGQEL